MDLCLCEICHIAVTFDKCKCYTRGWIRKGKTSVRGKQLVEQETWKKQTRRSIISCCWKYFTPSYIILCHPATKTNFLVSKHTPFCRQYQCVSVTFYIDKVQQELVMVIMYANSNSKIHRIFLLWNTNLIIKITKVLKYIPKDTFFITCYKNRTFSCSVVRCLHSFLHPPLPRIELLHTYNTYM